MGFDALSPVASAQVNVLLVPADNVKRSRFESFVSRLKDVHEVRLGDLRPNAGSETFSPLAFPSGRLLFKFAASETRAPSVDSFPFELNREPQVVLALADGETLLLENNSQDDGKSPGDIAVSTSLQSLLDRLEDRKLHYKRAIVHQLLVFDVSSQGQEDHNVIFVPSPAKSHLTTIKTVICDIGALFLNAMHDLGTALQDLPTIESPSTVASAELRNGSQDYANKARLRMSMPSSPSPNAASGRSPLGLAQTGATPPTSKVNSELRSRDQSRDGDSIQDSETSEHPPRLVVRVGRALVVKGAMYLQAGRWPDALKTLAEGVAVAQANIDYLWHARGLEHILTCMLMCVWAELPFEIPDVCLPSAELRAKTEPTFYTPEVSNGDTVSPVQGSDPRPSSMQHLMSLFPDVIR